MVNSNPMLGTTVDLLSSTSNHKDPVNPSDAAQDLEFTEEDDWITVKRRRIDDWIPPPLLSSENFNFESSVPGHFLHDIPYGGFDDYTCNHPAKTASTSTKRLSAKAKSKSSLSAAKKAPLTRNISSMAKSEKLLSRDSSSHCLEVVATKTAAPQGNLCYLTPSTSAWHGSGSIKPPSMFPGLTYSSNGSARLSETLRASNIDRKLRKAGGLSQWLMSIGLERFVPIFQSRNVGKFQLVHMSMDKLKEMGTDAVGPRRKLMHAIECLCQPPCFQV